MAESNFGVSFFQPTMCLIDMPDEFVLDAAGLPA